MAHNGSQLNAVGDRKHKCFTLIQKQMDSTKDQIKHSIANDGKPPVIGSFSGEAALEYLIKKWYSEAAKIEELTKPTESKHQQQVANHFLIQLYGKA